MLHDLALHQGRPGLGGFAPPPRGQKPAVKPVHRQGGGDAETSYLLPWHGGTAEGQSAQVGAGQAGAQNTGFRAQLAEAKAAVAPARQAREARQGSVPSRAVALAPQTHSFAPIARHGTSAPMRMAARQRFAGAGADLALDFGLSGMEAVASPENLCPDPVAAPEATAMTPPAMSAASGGMSQTDFGRALEAHCLRLSRLPPIGGAGFSSTVSPVFAGMKIPV